jgi:DNA modification methylase
VATTYRALALAKAAATDPDIAGAKSEKEAYKLLTRKEERKRYADLAISAPEQSKEERHTLVQGDCLSWMRAQQAEQYQIILTDPPYGMGADTFGDAAGKLQGIEHHYDDSFAGTQRLLAEWFPESFRLAAPQSFLFLWCDIDLFPWLKLQATLAGWKPHRTPFINTKKEGGRVPWPDSGPRRCYELCLYATKGEVTSRSIVRDVFESVLTERNYGHGAQKPVEAYEYLLRFVARPGDRVLDTFAGTGTLIDAAENLGIASTCIEQDPAHFGIMLERLRALGDKNATADFFGFDGPGRAPF